MEKTLVTLKRQRLADAAQVEAVEAVKMQVASAIAKIKKIGKSLGFTEAADYQPVIAEALGESKRISDWSLVEAVTVVFYLEKIQMETIKGKTV